MRVIHVSPLIDTRQSSWQIRVLARRGVQLGNVGTNSLVLSEVLRTLSDGDGS